MKTFELKGELKSATGKKVAKAIRAEGKVPCVLYGGKENVHFTVENAELKHLIYTDTVYVVDLMVDGKKYQSVLKDIQFHPVSDEILHIDFYEVSNEKPVIVELPVDLEGFAEGVKAGGKLQKDMRYLKVKGNLTELPERLKIDITNLGLGKTVQVGELSFPNIEILNAKNAVVAAVKLTRAARAKAE